MAQYGHCYSRRKAGESRANANLPIPPIHLRAIAMSPLGAVNRSWRHLLSLDTIPQVGSAIATWLPTGRRKLGRRRPVSSNGPLFRRDHGV